MNKTIGLVLTGALFFSLVATAGEVNLKQVAAGNLVSLNRAFDELNESDGAESEDLTAAIGGSIRLHTTNFLKSFKSHEKVGLKFISAIAGNLGENYADQLKKQKREVRLRIIALEAVKDESLKSVATMCIHELKRVEKDLKKF